MLLSFVIFVIFMTIKQLNKYPIVSKNHIWGILEMSIGDQDIMWAIIVLAALVKKLKTMDQRNLKELKFWDYNGIVGANKARK